MPTFVQIRGKFVSASRNVRCLCAALMTSELQLTRDWARTARLTLRQNVCGEVEMGRGEARDVRASDKLAIKIPSR